MPATTDTQTVLAFDYGERRVGVAIGQTVTASATPLTTLDARNERALLDAIRSLLRDWRPSILVVGDPSARPQGDPIRQAVRRFADLLKTLELPVEFVDESLSSVEAEERLKDQRRRRERGRIDKPVIDAEAARVIAERWLAAGDYSARMRRNGEPGPDTADA